MATRRPWTRSATRVAGAGAFHDNGAGQPVNAAVLPSMHPRSESLHPFRYVAATSIDEAVAVLSEHGARARPLAGGTDLLVQLRGDRFELDALVDVKGLSETMELRLDHDGLYIGAAVPCYRIYEDNEAASAYPGIIDAASLIGGIQIQSRASLGGNLCNASPSADGVCPLIAHSAVAVVAGPAGTRTVPVEEFCTGPGSSVLADGELLVGLRTPVPAARFGAAYERFIPRNEMDIAVVGVASAVVLDASGEGIESARIALAAVGPKPIFAAAASDSLAGVSASVDQFRAAGDVAAGETSPIDDMRGTAEQRHELVRVLTRRTLERAVERARNGNGRRRAV